MIVDKKNIEETEKVLLTLARSWRHKGFNDVELLYAFQYVTCAVAAGIKDAEQPEHKDYGIYRDLVENTKKLENKDINITDIIEEVMSNAIDEAMDDHTVFKIMLTRMLSKKYNKQIER